MIGKDRLGSDANASSVKSKIILCYIKLLWKSCMVLMTQSTIQTLISACDCVSKEVVDDFTIQKRVLTYLVDDDAQNISCLDTSKVTFMSSLFDSYFYYDYATSIFNGDISCWETSLVTDMSVSLLLFRLSFCE